MRLMLGILMLFGVSAHAMEPVEVGETRFARASLTVVGPEGEKSYDPAALEAFGTYALETVTPWRPDRTQFVGIRLRDLLDAHGIAHVPAIRVIAENDYAITISRDNWTRYDPLIATRVDGKGHSRRNRGPLQFIFDMSSTPSVGDEAFQSNWVWMAARIEIAD